jgi:hypothetical protein
MTPVIFAKRYTLGLPVEPYPRTTAVGSALADGTASRTAVPTVAAAVTSNGDCGAGARGPASCRRLATAAHRPQHWVVRRASYVARRGRSSRRLGFGHRRPTPRPSR